MKWQSNFRIEKKTNDTLTHSNIKSFHFEKAFDSTVPAANQGAPSFLYAIFSLAPWHGQTWCIHHRSGIEFWIVRISKTDVYSQSETYVILSLTINALGIFP